MTKRNFIEDDILLCDKKVFRDLDEHEYKGRFYDGFAILRRVDYEEEVSTDPERLMLLYPTMSVAKTELADDICHYCGITKLEMNYHDVALRYGDIVNLTINVEKLLAK